MWLARRQAHASSRIVLRLPGERLSLGCKRVLAVVPFLAWRPLSRTFRSSVVRVCAGGAPERRSVGELSCALVWL